MGPNHLTKHAGTNADVRGAHICEVEKPAPNGKQNRRNFQLLFKHYYATNTLY